MEELLDEFIRTRYFVVSDLVITGVHCVHFNCVLIKRNVRTFKTKFVNLYASLCSVNSVSWIIPTKFSFPEGT